METRRIAVLSLVGAMMILASCDGSVGVEGKRFEWLKGKALSLKADFTSGGVFLEMRNDSDREISIDPIRLIVWGRRSGKNEQEFGFSTPKDRILRPKGSFKLGPFGGGDTTKIRVILGPRNTTGVETFTVK